MGDNVVKFASNAGSFIGDGLACPGVLLGFESFGAVLEQCQIVAAVADSAPQIPGQAGKEDGELR